LIVGEEN
jgi:hypothetical protein